MRKWGFLLRNWKKLFFKGKNLDLKICINDLLVVFILTRGNSMPLAKLFLLLNKSFLLKSVILILYKL